MVMLQQIRSICEMLVRSIAATAATGEIAQGEMSHDKFRMKINGALKRMPGADGVTEFLEDERTQKVGRGIEPVEAKPPVTPLEGFRQSALVGQAACQQGQSPQIPRV